jgi:thiosulfate/3-mercaptopyruvate sulfurtransferase
LKFRNLRLCVAATLIAIYGVNLHAQQPAAPADTAIPPEAILQPAELAQMLNTSPKPLVLQTGSHVLFAEAHIAGAEYAGPAGKSEGIEALRARVAGLSKDSLISSIAGAAPGSVARISGRLTQSCRSSGLPT